MDPKHRFYPVIETQSRIEMEKNEKAIRILILAANPHNTQRLHLGDEIREIREGIRRSIHRDRFEIVERLAVRIRDLRRALLDIDPHFVHFCGHAKSDGILLVDDNGASVSVKPGALSELFALFAKSIKCVILNACYSEIQANAIGKYIRYVVGTKKEIPDRAAIEFAVGFYDGLGADRSVEQAFQLGCNAIDLQDMSQDWKPILIEKANRPTTEAQLILAGEYEGYDKTTENELVQSLAKILKVGKDAIRILRVTKGSIRIILELPVIGARELIALQNTGSKKLGQFSSRFHVKGIEVKYTLGKSPLILTILEEILKEKLSLFRELSNRRKVQTEDVDMVINETYLKIIALHPQGRIEDLLSLTMLSPKKRDRLKESLTALFVHYLKWACRDYIKKRNLDTDSLVGIPYSGSDQFLRLFLTSLWPVVKVDIDKFIQGDQSTVLKFYEDVATVAGLTEEQSKFLLYKAKNPSARDQDFDTSLKPHQITRIKRPAMQKILNFLSHIEKREARFTKQSYSEFLRKFPQAKQVLAPHLTMMKDMYYVEIDNFSNEDIKKLGKKACNILKESFNRSHAKTNDYRGEKNE